MRQRHPVAQMDHFRKFDQIIRRQPGLLTPKFIRSLNENIIRLQLPKVEQPVEIVNRRAGISLAKPFAPLVVEFIIVRRIQDNRNLHVVAFLQLIIRQHHLVALTVGVDQINQTHFPFAVPPRLLSSQIICRDVLI